MTNPPDPLTPPDCDLRGLPYMPLDVIRLVDSDLMALASGEEFKAAVTLWCKSWVQIPAGSLPDDDKILAFLSGTGARWKKIKAGALRGFVKCSDGRLYHPVVAEKALEALPARQEYQEKKSGDTERKQREREARKEMFAQLRAIGITPEYNTKTSKLRDLVTKHVTGNVTPVTGHVTQPVTANKGEESKELARARDRSQERDMSDPAPDVADAMARLCNALGMTSPPGDMRRLAEWIGQGADIDRDIIPVAERTAGNMRKRGDRPQSFRLIERDVLAAVKDRRAQEAAEGAELEDIRRRYPGVSKSAPIGGYDEPEAA